MGEDEEGVSERIKISLLVISSLSLFATTFIILFYILNKTYRSFSFDLVLMLCMSDFVYSLVSFIRAIIMVSSPDTEIGIGICYIQGLLIQTSIVSSYICTSTICYSLFQWIVREAAIFRKSAFKQYWMINFLLPFISGLFLCAFQLIGRLDPFPNTFCYISTGDMDKDQLLMLIFYYLPFLLCFLLNCYLVTRILIHYKRNEEQFQTLTLKDILKMCLYPLALFICWFPIIFFRILRYYGVDSQFMVEVGFVMDNMNGLLNAIFYYFISINPMSCCDSSQDQSSQEDSSPFQESVKDARVSLNNEGEDNFYGVMSSGEQEGISKIYLVSS